MNVFIRTTLVFLFAFSSFAARPAAAYSVLSHEEVVDMAWLPHIVPLLRARYPGLTDDDIKTAHAYAYGGSVIQDIGYYPFGSHQFSDLLHYVRTGDFVSALIRDSTNVNEYAFALGALAHYCGDVNGHPAVNHVTSDEYPKLRRRYGQSVTYGENPTAHLRTEFGFDVVEVAHGRYLQQNYRDFIGFQVAKELLNRAFLETYCVPVDSIMKKEDLAIGSYRHAVSGLIPKMTTVALVDYKSQIEKENPGFERRKFLYRLRRTEYEKEYGKQYVRPGIGSRVLADIIDILPKVGPFKVFALKVPTPAEQDLYLKSVNATVDKFDNYLADLQVHPGKPSSVPRGLNLSEIDLDTGKSSHLGEYQLADKAYAGLLDKLIATPSAMSSDVHQSFLDFYSGRTKPAWYVKNPKEWQKLQANLVIFDALPKSALAPNNVASSSEPVLK